MRLSEDARKCVVYLGSRKSDSENEIEPVGTGFLVHMGTPGGGYLVTAAHVAHDLDRDFDIRLNEEFKPHHGDGPGQGRIDSIVGNNWYEHPTDKNVDVAVMPYEPPEWADVSWFPYKYFLSEYKLGTKNTGPGDFAYVVGLLHFMQGTMRNMPAVHTGHIVLMPDREKIPISNWRVKNGKRMLVDAYLVQAGALPGSSGSPVFIRRSLDTHMELPKIQPDPLVVSVPGSLWFLGVWRGAWFGKAADGLRVPKNREKVPVGLGTVVPAVVLAEVLNQPKLMAQRKEPQDAEREKIPADEPLSLNRSAGDALLGKMLEMPPKPISKPGKKAKKKAGVRSQ